MPVMMALLVSDAGISIWEIQYAPLVLRTITRGSYVQTGTDLDQGLFVFESVEQPLAKLAACYRSQMAKEPAE